MGCNCGGEERTERTFLIYQKVADYKEDVAIKRMHLRSQRLVIESELHEHKHKEDYQPVTCFGRPNFFSIFHLLSKEYFICKL